MKVFISWSGALSEQLGTVLREWLPGSLQFVRPYFTPRDVDKGARWASEIAGELEKTSIGIFCLTRENIAAPWLVFEAGAMSRIVSEAHVCPLLFGLEPGDISGPLSQFQATRFNEKEFHQLYCTINRLAGENSLDESTRDKVYEMWWPQLRAGIDEVFTKYKPPKARKVREDRELIEETLMLTRTIAREVRAARESALQLRLENIARGRNEGLNAWPLRSSTPLTRFISRTMDASQLSAAEKELWDLMNRGDARTGEGEHESGDPGGAGSSS